MHIVKIPNPLLVFPPSKPVTEVACDGHFGIHRALRSCEPPRMVAKKGRPSDLRQLLSELQAAVDAWGGLPRTSERLKRSTSSQASDRAVVCNRFTFAAMQDIFKTQLQDLKNRFEGQGDNRISGMPKSLICCHL